MTNIAIIWTFASVFAAACFAQGLKMRDNPRMLYELLWYTAGAFVLCGAALLWISLEGEIMTQHRIILGFVGAVFGALALLSAGEWVHSGNAATVSAKSQQSPGNPFIQPTQNITSYNQSGGITAGVVNVAPAPRSLNNEAWAATLKSQILSQLPKDKPIIVMAIAGDQEAMSLAQEIHAFLKENGFPLAEENGISQGFFSGPVKGLEIRDDEKTRTFIVGANLK